MWNNLDEVKAFIEGHKDRWLVGDKFVLPDIEQAYEVVAVRPFRHRGRFKLFVDLEAMCAVDGCGEYLLTTKEVHQWMNTPYLTRCCEKHLRAFSTPMADAWKSVERRAEDSERRAVAPPRAKKPRVGVIEHVVMVAFDDLCVVDGRPAAEAVIALAMSRLKPRGSRDTRRQVVVRALARLERDGLLQPTVADL